MESPANHQDSVTALNGFADACRDDKLPGFDAVDANSSTPEGLDLGPSTSKSFDCDDDGPLNLSFSRSTTFSNTLPKRGMVVKTPSKRFQKNHCGIDATADYDEGVADSAVRRTALHSVESSPSVCNSASPVDRPLFESSNGARSTPTKTAGNNTAPADVSGGVGLMTRLGLSSSSRKQPQQHATPNLSRTKLYNSLSTLEKKGILWSTFYEEDDENVKKVLQAVASDHSIVTDPSDKRKRRTIVIERNELQKFGFTVQTYVFQRDDIDELKQVSYVDYVDLNSPASHSGLRAGDVIVSINGVNVRELDHKSLIRLIATQLVIRVVVLFEDCVKKIDLCTRAIKLEKLLADKEFERRLLEIQEERICQGVPPQVSSEERRELLRHWSSSDSAAAAIAHNGVMRGATSSSRLLPPSTSCSMDESGGSGVTSRQTSTSSNGWGAGVGLVSTVERASPRLLRPSLDEETVEPVEVIRL